MSIVIIINSFGLIQRTILTKEVDFKTQTRITLVSSILSGIGAVLLAFLGFGVWALVFRNLIMQFIQALLLTLHNKWRPKLEFNIDSFKRLFGFGWKLLISGLLNTVYDNIYYLIIGRYFSTTSLGYFTNAKN